MTKVLLYSHTFAPNIGGVETSVESLAQGLHGSAGMEVTLVTHTPVGAFDDSAFSFPVVRRPSFRKLWSLISESDIVHVAGPALPPLFLAFVARKPFVVEHHGYQAICPNGLLSYLPDRTVCPQHFQAHRYWKCLQCQNVERSAFRSLLSLLLMFPRLWLVRRAGKNVAITRHVLERHKLPRSGVIYYGIEDRLDKENGRFPSTQTDNTICFGFVGRFVPEKGIPILLEATHQLAKEGRKFSVRLVGDGPERPMLERIIRRDRLENHVVITGYLRGPKLDEALSDVGVVVMPSVWEETAGLAAMEQMMRGKLVIASRIGGLAEIVGSTGLCFTCGSADDLTQCMRRALQEPSLVEALSGQARRRAASLFARSRMLEEHRQLYQMVMQHAASTSTGLPDTDVH